MKIGVLALQGAFAEHRNKLEKLGADCFEIRSLRDLSPHMDGLILPGGESTVQGKLLRELALLEPLRDLILGGLPVLGTCAGLILLAEQVEGEIPHIGTLPVTVCRNAYGRQLGSFATTGRFGEQGNIPMTFIRGPYVSRTGKGVRVLSQVDGRVVAVQKDSQIGVAFHPELCESDTVHLSFLRLANRRGALRAV